VADALGAGGFLDPVTVAGPHRACTGLPLTTDRIYRGESIRIRAAGFSSSMGSGRISLSALENLSVYGDSSDQPNKGEAMGRGIRRQAPALLIACVALLAALGGSVYAATKINGRTIRVKSLPGNRLAIASLPGNRLKPGAIAGDRLAPGSITGAQLDVATLGQVPSAVHADNADSARDAQTALNAVNAIDAVKVNGHSAGCAPPARFFAGGCWQASSSDAAVTAPAAALSCATQGGELPGALALAAFSQQPGIALAPGDEWTQNMASYTSVNSYSVATVSADSKVGSALSSETKKYRCVIPLVS
jgi:hypothetical protein